MATPGITQHRQASTTIGGSTRSTRAGRAVPVDSRCPVPRAQSGHNGNSDGSRPVACWRRGGNVPQQNQAYVARGGVATVSVRVRSPLKPQEPQKLAARPLSTSKTRWADILIDSETSLGWVRATLSSAESVPKWAPSSCIYLLVRDAGGSAGPRAWFIDPPARGRARSWRQ
jgi:hypothetical protein